MNPDELEFSISQYLDGTLPPLEAARVEEILASDASAREIFAEYQRLDDSLRAMPQAQVDFEAFASSMSEKLAREDLPLTTYRIGFTRVLQVSAIAASLLVVIGTAVMLFKQAKTQAPETPVAIASNPSIQVSGPTIEVGSSPAVAVISIGPAPGYADASRHSYEAVVSRPTRVVIASGTRQAQDNGDLPY